jgi:hypothetical protein
MAEVTPLPTPERPPSPHPSPLAFGSFRWQTLWTAVGGLAGAAGLVYGVGSAIEAMRLNAAGLPVEQALSLVPKTTVLALAINALLLPAVVSGSSA